MKKIVLIYTLLCGYSTLAQQTSGDSTVYKKRVLESAEVSFLTSYYQQSGNNSAVGGGIGTEELTDVTPTIVVSIPVNDNDVLTVDAGISAYSSASSSNINPFDGKRGESSPFQASSGESQSDALTSVSLNYTHSSDDRNSIWSGHLSVSKEYDYGSVGIGGSYTKLFNQKNTEFTIKGNAYFDKWQAIYPIELQAFVNGGTAGDDDEVFRFNQHTITGNTNYNTSFQPFNSETRNSYTLGLTLTQIMSRDLQGALILDLVKQNGLLSTPYQRVYFSDVADSFIENFQLADDVEQLPNTRFKIAVGGRLNYYINERLTIRTYYRYYQDDWGLKAHTASIMLPIKLTDRFTLYPNYRYYTQSQVDYFASHESHLSTERYYTSDYDLSSFHSNQYGLGISYTDIFTKFKIWKAGLKEVNLSYNQYRRSTGLDAGIVSFGLKFIID